MTLEITYKGDSLKFDISSLITRGKGVEAEQFGFLNRFLEYKGEKFTDRLWDLYVTAYNRMQDFNFISVDPLPYKEIHDILDMFDLDEVENFIVTKLGFRALNIISASFDKSMEVNKEGTRIQTYIKSEYVNLISILLPLKAVIGPIGMYGTRHKGELKDKVSYYLTSLILTHPFAKKPAMVKIQGLVDKIVESSLKSSDDLNNKVYSNTIPKEDINTWALSMILYQVVTMTTPEKESDNDHIINRMYRKLMHKTGDDKKGLSPAMVSGSDEDENQRSYLESWRSQYDLTTGQKVELEYAVEDLESKLTGAYPFIDLTEYESIKFRTRNMHNMSISKVNITLIGWTLKRYIDPRSLLYISGKHIVILANITYCVLKHLGHLTLARSALSIEEENSDNTYNMSSKVRINPVLKAKLEALYPTKFDNATTALEKSIVMLYDLLTQKSLNTLAPLNANEKITLSMPSNLKDDIVNMLLDIEELSYGYKG